MKKECNSFNAQRARRYSMNRRTFLKNVALGTAATGAAGTVFGADKYFPTKVDPALFETINRVKDLANETPLEKLHGPVIKAPSTVKGGAPFTVEVSVGEVLHPMGQSHWIEFIELDIGNEPAGRVAFQSRGYLTPKATFTVTLAKESFPLGKATLVVHQRCNIHGYWEGSLDISVA
jgi:superoxide reductase